MKVDYLTPLRVQFYATAGRDQWQLTDPFKFKVDAVEYEIPSGFWTDFASVPQALWSVISPYDLGVGPIPHDAGYRLFKGDKAYWDDVFLSCMRRDRVSLWKRLAAYQAVSWFGSHAWGQPVVMSRGVGHPYKAPPYARGWQVFVEQVTAQLP